MSRHIELPRTGREVLARMFPFMDQMVTEDVEHIRLTQPDTKVVSMRDPVPGTPHGLEGIFDAYIGWNARRQARERGLTEEEAERQYRAYMAGRRADLENLVQMLRMEYACLLNFRLNGEKVFYVADALSERLAHSEANLRCDHLNLPFPSFEIVFTSKTAIDLYYNHIGADGQLMSDRKGIDYEAPLTVFVTRLPADEEGPDTLLVNVLQAREIPHRDPAMHALSSRQLNLDPEWDIEAAIRTDWKDLDAESGVERARGEDAGNPTALPDKVFYQQGYAFYRLVMNTILYLTSKNAEREDLPPASQQMKELSASQESSKWRKRYERRARFMSDAPFEMVGRSVQPIAFGEGSRREGESNSAGRKIERRFLVRGHWRAQAVGPGRSERRTIFIEPFYKGPDISDEVNRPFLVRQDGRQIIGEDDVE